VSFRLAPGESLAVTGPSGAGKSTLLRCLMGLVRAEGGEVRFEGLPVDRHPGYRRAIAGVLQDDRVMAGSILDNIACFEAEADLERVAACAALAAVHEDILALPMQYHTWLGDLGPRLSGGQQQRILIARALYRQPAVLFLDEATSQLDLATEAAILDGLRRLGLTRIIVSHRAQTLRAVDRVLTL
jgi:ATP-binding cassette subfamily B protein RaxB